jgi:hypothetical protein
MSLFKSSVITCFVFFIECLFFNSLHCFTLVFIEMPLELSV